MGQNKKSEEIHKLNHKKHTDAEICWFSLSWMAKGNKVETLIYM